MQLFLCVLLFSFILSSYATMQNITVSGIAVCNKKRQANVKVQLYDRDTLDFNDLLAETHTDSNGEFTLFGQEDEIGKIEPFVRILHSCDMKQVGCSRQSDYTVPQDKIGSKYEMTYVTLNIVVHGEKEICP